MERRDFIRTGCLACLSGGLLLSLLDSCTPEKILSATISGSDLLLPLSSFEVLRKGEKQFKKYVVVQHESLQFPICIYRLNEVNYTALYMQCSHQGAELQVFGDKLQCPAHGSEFSNTGAATNPPATQPLRSFPITIDSQVLKISLK